MASIKQSLSMVNKPSLQIQTERHCINDVINLCVCMLQSIVASDFYMHGLAVSFWVVVGGGYNSLNPPRSDTYFSLAD